MEGFMVTMMPFICWPIPGSLIAVDLGMAAGGHQKLVGAAIQWGHVLAKSLESHQRFVPLSAGTHSQHHMALVYTKRWMVWTCLDQWSCLFTTPYNTICCAISMYISKSQYVDDASMIHWGCMRVQKRTFFFWVNAFSDNICSYVFVACNGSFCTYIVFTIVFIQDI